MSLPYETSTAGDKALIEIQRILAKFGCQSFGTMTDAERGLTIVQFKWRDRQISLEASWKGYAAAWQKEHPWARVHGNDRAAYDRKALEDRQGGRLLGPARLDQGADDRRRVRRHELRCGVHAAHAATERGACAGSGADSGDAASAG